MTQSKTLNNNLLIYFDESIEKHSLPKQFTSPFSNTPPHPLCSLAVKQLQNYLLNQTDWQHNFGLTKTNEGPVIGKMFGVLIVKTLQNEIGYLAAYSGKLANSNHLPQFVPSVFDGLKKGSFLNTGMKELTLINQEIKEIEQINTKENTTKIDQLKKLRKANSIALQGKIFDSYSFLNQQGEEKTLRDIFQKKSHKNPPSGAGECAAPKLLQYAFQHKMKPLAITEFWWGLSPKSNFWKHGHFYPACKEKCEPILTHMLKGFDGF